MTTAGESAAPTPSAAHRGGPAVAASGFGWLLLYLLVAVTPLLVAATAAPPPGRDFWTELSVGLGFVGLAMMGLQFAVISRFPAVNAPFGLDVVLGYHRQISFVTYGFILAHPIILLVRRPGLLEALNPVTASWQARFGLLSVAALTVLIVTSVWRRGLGIRYEVWRVLHGLLAVTAVGTALAHIQQVGYYVDGLWKQVLWIAMSLAFLGLLVNVYFIEPFRLRNRPWEVESVQPQPGAVWTLTLRPVGHGGLRFAPGQFAWLRVNRSPFSVREHPFSFASSAERPERLAFGIKESGDFTSRIGDLRPGTRVYLDGPYGVFTLDRKSVV